MDISKDELLSLLFARGYSIIIDDAIYHKTVTFTSSTSVPLTLSRSYSTEWTNEQICDDVVYDLLKWTGLKVKYTLDY